VKQNNLYELLEKVSKNKISVENAFEKVKGFLTKNWGARPGSSS